MHNQRFSDPRAKPKAFVGPFAWPVDADSVPARTSRAVNELTSEAEDRLVEPQIRTSQFIKKRRR